MPPWLRDSGSGRCRLVSDCGVFGGCFCDSFFGHCGVRGLSFCFLCAVIGRGRRGCRVFEHADTFSFVQDGIAVCPVQLVSPDVLRKLRQPVKRMQPQQARQELLAGVSRGLPIR